MTIKLPTRNSEEPIFDDWRSENYTGDFVPQVGCKKLNLPPDPKKKALLYQICLKINEGEIELFPFCQDYTDCSPDGARSYFNKFLFKPLVESIKEELNNIKGVAEQGNKQGIHTLTKPNPWKSGSFYLATVVIVVILFSVVAKTVSPMVLSLIIISALITISIVGAFQLRQDESLSEENFLTLISLTFKQLLFIRRNNDTDNDKKKSD